MMGMEKCDAGQAAVAAECAELERDGRGPARLTLNDRQLVVLSAAARREERLIEVPQTLKGRAYDVFGQALRRHGLAVEVLVTVGQPVWRHDETSGCIGLVATAAALTALGIKEGQAGEQVPVEDLRQPVTAHIPRAGSKQAQLVGMLSAGEGCSVVEAAHALGWLPHTPRAAMTGLRHKGHVIERINSPDGKASRHRIVAAAPATAA